MALDAVQTSHLFNYLVSSNHHIVVFLCPSFQSLKNQFATKNN